MTARRRERSRGGAGSRRLVSGDGPSRTQRIRRTATQFARFLVVGGLSFAIDYGVFLLLHSVVGVPYVIASAISLSLSLIVNYVLTVRFVFEARPGRNVAREFAVYIVISLVAIGLNQLILLACVELLLASPEIGKLIATAVVLVFNFVARKLLIERRPRSERTRRPRSASSRSGGARQVQ